jgi:hypothetical protein
VTDFRDHIVKKALDETIGPWRPEKTLRSRLRRIAAVAALAIAAVAAFAFIIDLSAPRPKPAAAHRKPVAVDILPAPRERR